MRKAELLQKIEALQAKVSMLEARIAAVEARPTPVYGPLPPTWRPNWAPNTGSPYPKFPDVICAAAGG